MRALFNSIEVPVTACSIQYRQSEIGVISISVPARYISREEIFFTSVTVFDNQGRNVAEGFVYETPEADIDEQGTLIYKVRATDQLGRLAAYRAKTDAHYQDQAVIAIISNLLATTDDWTLGSAATITDPSIKTTLDLRGKETLFAQIAEVCRAVPSLYLRFGGYNSGIGKFLLDIGYFGEPYDYLAIDDNIISLEIQTPATRPVRILEAYSNFGGDQQITLQQALSYPGILSHPDYAGYPIVSDLAGKYYIQSTEIAQGVGESKSFNVNKTKNENPPTTTEIFQAAYAMWLKAVRYMKSKAPTVNLKARIWLPIVPPVASSLFVKATATERVYDTMRHTSVPVVTVELATYMRLVSYSVNLTDIVSKNGVDGLVVDMDLSQNPDVEDPDPVADLYDKLERFDEADSGRSTVFKGSAEVTVSHLSSAPADCDSNTGKDFTFPMPSVPVGSVAVYSTVITATPGTVTFTITQAAALPSTPLRLCVKVGGGWGSANASVTVRYDFL